MPLLVPPDGLEAPLATLPVPAAVPVSFVVPDAAGGAVLPALAVPPSSPLQAAIANTKAQGAMVR
jgi:hypothetical protein